MTKTERKMDKDDLNSSSSMSKQLGKKVFIGEIRIKDGDEYEILERERKEDHDEKEFQFDIPLPYVAPHIIKILGIRVIRLLWREFLHHGADETELVLIESLPEIFESVQQEIGHDIPFHKIKYTATDEFTDFQYVIHNLANALNQPGALPIQIPVRVPLPPCCAFKSCQLHSRIDEKYLSGTEKRSNFRLDVIYRRNINQKNGIVRVNDIPAMMAEAEIPYNLNPLEMNLPSNYWIVNGDKLVLSYEQLFETVELIRTDIDNDMSLETIYKLPKWLKNEFTPNEILLFRHHFMMIDIDCGGTIDVEELQLLGESLGNPISEDEAKKIIAEHDTDGEGSLNFEEFMTLMFQILRGTIDIQTDVLAKTMMESRNQIKIFEEIEGIKSLVASGNSSGILEGEASLTVSHCDSHTTSVSNISNYVRVLHYGGIPVECDYQITGPSNTPYAGGKFVINVVYCNGYPFQSPICICKTRILHINFIPLINGSYSVPHLEFLWDSSWTTKDLLEHIYDLLLNPNPRYLSEDLIAVYNSYLLENYEVDDEASMLLTSVFSNSQNPNGNDDPFESQGKSKSYRELLRRMPRMRQYHMNLVVKFMLDIENFELMVRQAKDKFAMKSNATETDEVVDVEESVLSNH